MAGGVSPPRRESLPVAPFAGLPTGVANASQVDVTEITRPRWRLLRARPRMAPATRAHAVLVVAAFLLGAVLSGLVFVGVWRHTAAAGDRAQTAQAVAERQLVVSRRRLTVLQRSLARVRTQRTTAAAELSRLKRIDGTVASRLPAQLQSVDSSAAAISHSISSLESELSALHAYLESPKPSGIDAGFVATQIRYLTVATRNTLANVAELNRRANAAAAIAAPLNAGK